jgi:hypothetical protein
VDRARGSPLRMRFMDSYDSLVAVQRRAIHVDAVALSEPVLDGGTKHLGFFSP